MPEVNKAAILEWVEALESGRYQQTTTTLAKIGPEGRVGYCCLGVACEVFGERLGVEVERKNGRIFFDSEAVALPSRVYEFLGFEENDVPVYWEKRMYKTSATTLNDTYRLTFQEIAAVLRANYLD